METERKGFEAAMWTYYLDLKAKGWSAPGEGDQTPEALFWREERGKYGVLSVEAAWNGWQMARKSVVLAPGAVNFQQRVQPWMLACFGEVIAADREERNHRFLEEALELVQSTGCTAHEAHQLVDYVYGRPVGESAQEVGGVMVTLAALCLANGLDMHDAAEVELARIWTKVEAIRAKQAAKPKHSPLPQAAPVAQLSEPPEGWKLVLVNSEFDDLMIALARAQDKGYMPDAMLDEWMAFEYRVDAPTTPKDSE